MTEYVPTAAERQNTTAQGDFLKLSGDGVFATLQGEGASAGAPAVFARLQNCNLHCGANDKGWKCDAWYTWDQNTAEYWQETTNVAIDQAAETIQTAWATTFSGETLPPRLVVTGGEPLLQQRKLPQLFDRLEGWKFEIETNGTVLPIDELRQAQINCSPKLASSGNTLRSRLRPAVLGKIATFPDHWFKFVVTDEHFNQDIAEVQQIVKALRIDPLRVMLMSEGCTTERLRAQEDRLAQAADQLGHTVTARNHIFWFGDKRAT